MADDPKDAPSLADRLFFLLEHTPELEIGAASAELWREILAALRAVEAVRALHNRKRTITMGGWWFSCEICGSQWPCDTAKAVHDGYAK